MRYALEGLLFTEENHPQGAVNVPWMAKAYQRIDRFACPKSFWIIPHSLKNCMMSVHVIVIEWGIDKLFFPLYTNSLN